MNILLFNLTSCLGRRNANIRTSPSRATLYSTLINAQQLFFNQQLSSAFVHGQKSPIKECFPGNICNPYQQLISAIVEIANADVEFFKHQHQYFIQQQFRASSFSIKQKIYQSTAVKSSGICTGRQIFNQQTNKCFSDLLFTKRKSSVQHKVWRKCGLDECQHQLL